MKITLYICIWLSLEVWFASPGFANESTSTVSQRAQELSRQSDQKRPADQRQVNLFGRPLIIGGEVSVESDYRKDFRLDPARADDVLNVESKAELELLFQWSDKLVLFLEAKAEHDVDVYAESGREESASELQRGQTWIYYAPSQNGELAIQVGRQNYRDKREWWWDSSLDSIRLHYNSGALTAQLAVAKELARVSTQRDVRPEEKDLSRVLAEIRWDWARKNSLSLFALAQKDHSETPTTGDVFFEKDEDEVDARLNWLGVRAMGRFKYRPIGKLYYWADVAQVRGDEAVADFDSLTGDLRIVDDVERRDVDAWAYDLGVTWQAQQTHWPSLTIGQAMGSGGESDDGTRSREFRQTGLQDNDVRFRGVNRFAYYGEALQPELSNIRINSIALGWPLLSNSSIELKYQKYRQESLSRSRNGRIGGRPNGAHLELGEELDIVIGIEESPNIEIELIIAGFKAGRAFGDRSGKWALNSVLSIDYNF